MEGSGLDQRSLQAEAQRLDDRSARNGWATLLARIFVSIVLIAALIGGGYAFQRYMVATKTTAPTQPNTERPRKVNSIAANTTTVQPMLRLYGQIAAGRSIDLRVLVAGEVARISPNLVEGGRVQAGEALITVDPFEFKGAKVRAQSELAEANARLVETRARITQERAARERAIEQKEIAEREVERLTTLAERGVTSSAALDNSRTRLSIAAAGVESRENQIKVLEAQLAREQAALNRLEWNLEKADRDITNTTLMAPFGGIASNVAAQAGKLLNVNDRVATIIDLDRFEVRFTLNDAEYGRLVQQAGRLEGRKVLVEWGDGTTKLKASGQIDRISPVVTTGTGGFDVYARLERSAATEAMRPGAFVTVLTPDIPFADVVRVPQSAVHPGGKVFAIGEDNRLSPIDVTVAGFAESDMLVRGDIPDGTVLMSTRLPNAGPGVLVQKNP